MTDPVQENQQTRVLIVDDDATQRSLIDSFLRVQGFQTAQAGTGEEALRLLAERPFQLMISDVRMPGISGLETMRRARAANETLPILLVTAYADVREAVAAMRDGALNYLSKPIDLDDLLASVREAVGLRSKAPPTFENKPLPPFVIARSPLMQAVYRDASLIAPSDSRVLITGESGAGKEVLADVLHGWSPRATAPLIKVRCAATPEVPLEMELFGQGKQAGRLEQASGGIIVLDEITGLSPALQAKLLRVIEDGEFHRVGSSVGVRSNARILAITSRNLDDEVKEGRFREDLFYRLNVVELNLPALRERREDILPLAGQFLAELTKSRAKLSSAASDLIEKYTWPGNVRELRNAMERAALLSRGELILPEHLPARVREEGGANSGAEPLDAQRLVELEEQAILNALRKNEFNRTETAKALGISRRGLIYKLQNLRERGHQVDPQ